MTDFEKASSQIHASDENQEIRLLEGEKVPILNHDQPGSGGRLSAAARVPKQRNDHEYGGFQIPDRFDQMSLERRRKNHWIDPMKKLLMQLEPNPCGCWIVALRMYGLCAPLGHYLAAEDILEGMMGGHGAGEHHWDIGEVLTKQVSQ